MTDNWLSVDFTRDTVASCAKDAENRLAEDPWFHGTVLLVANHVLQHWDEQGIPTEDYRKLNEEVLQSFREFLLAKNMSSDDRIARAGVLLKSLLCR